MKTYVWLTFAFMGWSYYEMSDGADFVPQQRYVAAASVDEPEIVTRAETPTLIAISTSNIVPKTVLADETTAPAVPVVAKIDAFIVDGNLDIREVAGRRVNMRMGPGTGFEVIKTLDNGTKLEVLHVDADGWANVSTERGSKGWMAERLLSDPET